ncbi:hypothetical protein D918_08404 [Trichuris suis]|nr:hypothetical protein D918_08404 [Trichuris suis]
MFTLLGAPSILQSDDGREFANKVVTSLKQHWPSLKIAHGKPRHSQSQGSVERANQDIENMLCTWTQDKKTDRWSDGLRFVQLTKNRAFHTGIKRTPYEALFGCKAKVGLATSSLPQDVLQDIQTEEELEEIIESVQTIPREERDSPLQETDSIAQEKKNETKLWQKSSCAICGHAIRDDRYEKMEGYEANILCNLCFNIGNAGKAKVESKLNLERQAKRMKVDSDKQFLPVRLGATVRVPAPDVDRGQVDARNLLAVVMSVTENGFCRLGTAQGVLNQLYARSGFTPCRKELIRIEDVPNQEIPVRSTAIAQSTGSGQGFLPDDEKKDAEKVKKALLAAFAVDPFVAYEQFSGRRLRSVESPDVFLADLRRLASLFGGVSEKALACAFVAGLPDSVRQLLRAGSRLENLGLDQILARARAVLIDECPAGVANACLGARPSEETRQTLPGGNPVGVEVIVAGTKPLGFDFILGINGIAALGGVTVDRQRRVWSALEDRRAAQPSMPRFCGWLRGATALIKRRVNDATSTWDQAIEDDELRMLLQEVVSEARSPDPARGMWVVAGDEARVWVDASSLAIGVALEVDGAIVEDASWLRSDEASHINMAELDAVVKGLNLAISWRMTSIAEFVYEPADGLTFDAWFTLFQDVFTIDCAALDDKAKVRFLLRKLSTPVHDKYPNFILPKKPCDFDFDQTVACLRQLFGSQASLFSMRYNCLKLVKRDTDDFVTYAAVINRACEEFQFGTLTEDQFKCLIFISGLQSSQDTELRLRLLNKLESDPQVNLQKLTEECNFFNRVRHDSRMMESKSHFSEHLLFVSAVSSHTQKLTAEQKRSQSTPAPQSGTKRLSDLLAVWLCSLRA